MSTLSPQTSNTRNALTITSHRGNDVIPFLNDLGRLRIEIFRDFPYLYAGRMEYESDYTNMYKECRNSFFTVVTDGEQVIGISTAVPLIETAEIIHSCFSEAGKDLHDFFYFGESVLDPHYRGRGIYKALFDAREEEAKRQGYKYATFIAVMRDQDDPAKPQNYQPLDETWTRYGYQRLNLYITIPYPTVARTSPATQKMLNNEGDIVPHNLQFWYKELD